MPYNFILISEVYFLQSIWTVAPDHSRVNTSGATSVHIPAGLP
jgi:hypothetical protein